MLYSYIKSRVTLGNGKNTFSDQEVGKNKKTRGNTLPTYLQKKGKSDDVNEETF